MYNTLICNYDGIKYFLSGVKFLKNNQKYLELNPLSNGEEKMKTLQSYELKTIDLESKMTKMSDNIDSLLQNYNETVDIINKKFALYNQLSTQTTPPSSHSQTFYDCGSNTTTGSAELAQIPSDWK